MKLKMNLKEIVTLAMPAAFCFSISAINAYDSLNSFCDYGTGILYSRYLQNEINKINNIEEKEFNLKNKFKYQKSIEYLEAQKLYNDILNKINREKGASSGFLATLFAFGVFSFARDYKKQKEKELFYSQLKIFQKDLKLRLL